MKLLIAGSRSYPETPEMIRLMLIMTASIFENNEVTEIISGGAKGIDKLAEKLASIKGIPFREFPADWLIYGKAAGPIRNKQMVEYCDRAIIVWDNISKGTKSTIDLLKGSGKPYTVYPISIENAADIIRWSEMFGEENGNLSGI